MTGRRWSRWAAVASLGALALWLLLGLLHRSRIIQLKRGCEPLLRPAQLDESLALGTRFLLANQRPDGRFNYAYNWREHRLVDEDNPVRQAGATWALALLYNDSRDPRLAKALTHALNFWWRHTREEPDYGRWIIYPGGRQGSPGTVALVLLAAMQGLESGAFDAEAQQRYRELARDFLRLLHNWRRHDGLWAGTYQHRDGRGLGSPSPYYDGEILLALAQAARLGFGAEPEAFTQSLQAALRRHVDRALARDRDSAETKGFFQWGIMAMGVAIEQGWGDVEALSQRVYALADWMIETHRTLERTRNTAYAHEGLLTALWLAQRRGDREREKYYRCVNQRGLARLTSWQLGHSLANANVTEFDGRDPLALGGVQNHAREPLLRIDVTQHQMHAVLMARRGLRSPAPGKP